MTGLRFFIQGTGEGAAGAVGADVGQMSGNSEASALGRIAIRMGTNTFLLNSLTPLEGPFLITVTK